MTANKDVIYSFLTRLLILLSGFATSIFTAHYLGPAGRGEYFFIATLAVLIVQVGCLGMQTSNIYLISKYEQALGALVSNAIWISIIIGTMSALVICIIFDFLHKNFNDIVFIAILGPTTLFYLLGVNFLIAINKIKLFNLFQISSNIILGIALLGCGLLGLGVKAFLVVTSLVWLAACLALIYVFYCETTIPFKFNFTIFRQSFSYSMKVYIATFLAALVLKGNIFLLKKFTSIAILGYYSIAAQICDALVIFPKTYSLLLFPKLIKAQKDSWARTKESLWLSSLSMILLYFLVAFAAKWIVPLVFGVQFVPSIPILLLMLPSSFCLGLTSIASQYLAAHNFPKALVLFWVIGFFCMLIFSMLLIPKFSGEGGAIALSLACLLILIMILSYCYYFNKILLQSSLLCNQEIKCQPNS